jgi:hypothetical protein
MNETKIKFLIDSLVEDMAKYLMEEKSLSLIDALDTIYNSQTYEKITDLSTGLYFQSSDYNYNLLQHEMKYGKVG